MSAICQMKHFVVPVYGGDEAEAALNRFLQNRAVLEVHREFWTGGAEACWCTQLNPQLNISQLVGRRKRLV